MASKRRACFVLLVSLLVVLMLAGGCRNRSKGKYARLVAAENMQLKRLLGDCEAETAKLKRQHIEDVKKLEDELTACRNRNEHLQKDLQEGIAERADSVTATVMAENARLRDEIKRLKEQTTLKARPLENP